MMKQLEEPPLKYWPGKLLLTNNKGEKIGQMENVNIDEIHDKIDVNRPYYPDDKQLCLLADLTYGKKFENNHINEECGEEWTLIVKAKNSHDGYFGTAFWHKENKHLVICHKGTRKSSFKDWQADYEGVLQNRITDQVHSACTFAYLVKTRFESVRCTISITGHSLGGWLAQITTFALVYLETDGNKFKSLKKDTFGKLIEKCHPHTVVFDSPGCHPMLIVLAEKYYHRYEQIRADQMILYFDVLNYVIRPNRINCLNKHIGTLLALIENNSDASYEMESESRIQVCSAIEFFKYNIKYHKLMRFKELLQANSTEMLKVVNWPTNQNKSIISGGSEYGKYHTGTNEEKQYLIDYEELEEKNSEHVEIPYKVKKFKEEDKYSKAFSKTELAFLKKLANCKKENLDFSKPHKFLKHKKIDCRLENFSEFEINENNDVTCGEFEKFVNCAKWLITFCPTIIEEMPPDRLSYEEQYREMTKQYLGEIESYRVDGEEITFKDNIGLIGYLGSQIADKNDDSQTLSWSRCLEEEEEEEEIQIMVIKATHKKEGGGKTFKKEEAFKIYTILKENKISDYSYLTWTQKEKLLSDHGINAVYVFASQSNIDKILIIDFEEQTDIKLLDEFYEAKINGSKKKIICIASETIEVNEPEKYKLVDKKIDNSTLQDLSDDSQDLILRKKIISLKGDTISLKEVARNYPGYFSEKLSFKLLKEYFFNSKMIDFTFENQHFQNVSFRLSCAKIEKEIEMDKLMKFLLNTDFSSKLSIRRNQNEPPKNYMFLITGFKKNDLNITRNFCLLQEFAKYDMRLAVEDESKPEKCLGIFHDFCREYKKSTIFWLHYQNDSFQWRQVYNSDFYIERSFKNRNAPNESLITEDNLIAKDEKVTVISDEPGTGKSSTMLTLANKIQQSWIMWINLVEACNHIDILSTVDLDSAAAFLLKFAEESSELSTLLLKFCLSKEKSFPVNLFFDGFDEIQSFANEKGFVLVPRDDVQKKILQLLLYLKNETQAKVWISTRSHAFPALEEKLGTVPVELQVISKKKQERFLRNFWLSKMSLFITELGIEAVKNSVAKFLIKWDAESYKQLRLILGVSLQLRLIGEIFQPENAENISTLDFDLFKLYQKYIDRKFDIFFTQKGLKSECDVISNFFMRMHGNLALRSFFKDDNNFIKHLDNRKYDLRKHHVDMNQIGLIQISDEDEQNYNFFHLTFVDYFSAYELIQLIKQRPESDVAEFAFQKVFSEPNFKLMRLFINGILEKEEDPENILTYYPKFWKTLKRNQLGNERGLSLHKLAKEGHSTIVKTILQCFSEFEKRMETYENLLEQFINTKDSSGSTALHLAIEFEYSKIVQLLLHHKASVTVQDKEGCNSLDLAADKTALKGISHDLIKKLGEIIEKKEIVLEELELADWVIAFEKKNWASFFEKFKENAASEFLKKLFQLFLEATENEKETLAMEIKNWDGNSSIHNLILILMELKKGNGHEGQYDTIISSLKSSINRIKKHF